MRNFFLIAGEASGDFYGAYLIKELLKKGSANFLGIGGKLMKEAGQHQLYSLDNLSVMGLWEGFFKVYKIRSIFENVVTYLERNEVDAIVLIDFPGFNLKLAKTINSLGIEIIYYVSPKVWAWKENRIKIIKRTSQVVMSIFPFEVSFYQQRNVPCKYTGNPLRELLSTVPPSKQFLSSLGKGPFVVLMPGSRNSEIKYNLTSLIQASAVIIKQFPGVQFFIPVAPTIKKEDLEKLVQKNAIEEQLEIEHVHYVSEQERYGVMKAADMALIVSGTATLEATFLGLPMIVVYRCSKLTYLVAKLLVKIKHISLTNIIAGQAIVPEMIQTNASGSEIGKQAVNLLGDDNRRQHIREELLRIEKEFQTTPFTNPADVVMDIVG